jgi:predicted dehydrogenase
MKQVLQNLRTGETYVAEVPIPTPKPGTALVRTAASLVSAGTERMVVEFAEKSLLGKAQSRPDLVRQVIVKARREGILTTVETALNRLDQPMPLGYSSAGRVVSLGDGVRDFRVGDRVACAGGGYAVHAEYVMVPQNLLAKLPDEADFESGSFATLGAIAMHGFRLAQAQLGERVAVIGLGLLGLLSVRIARAAGCYVLGVDLDPDRVAEGERAGALAVHREGAEVVAQEFSQGSGVDAVLVCADTDSNDPVNLAGDITRHRARVIVLGAVGLDIPRKTYFEKELSMVVSRSYGPGRYDPAYEDEGQDYPIGYVRWTEGRNLKSFVDFLAEGRLDVRHLITHRYPIEQAPQAYEMITGKHKEVLGVLFTYPEVTEEIGQPTTRDGIGAHPDLQPARKDAVRLGVLGAGNFATAVMLPALKKIAGVKMVGVVSPSGLSAQHALTKFGFHYAGSDESQIIDDPVVNTVAILTRHNLHAGQVIAALGAGKHVFCEKPLAIHRDDLEKIASILDVQRGKSLLMVGFNRRFAPLSQRLHAFLAGRNEPLIAHYRVNAGYLPMTHWLHNPDEGGGRIIGEGCHFVDYLTFLVGDVPVSVHARALPNASRYRDDNVQLTFTFRDGSIGTVTYLANGDKIFPKERVEVFCGGRVAVLDDYRSLETVYNGKRQVHRTRLRQDKGHRAEWEVFSKAIIAGVSPPIPYEHLFGVMEATFSASEALPQNKEVQVSEA